MKKIFRSFYYRYLRPGKKQQARGESKEKQKLSSNLHANLAMVRETLGNSNDVVIRHVKTGIDKAEAFLLYIDGMVDNSFVAENIIKPLIYGKHISGQELSVFLADRMLQIIRESILTAGEVKDYSDLDLVLQRVLSGDTALFVAGMDKAYVISTRGFETRGINEPDTESVVRGPREGFTEVLRINTSLLRRKIKSPDLRFEQLTVGKQTKTEICIAYVKGICNEKIVEEVRRRLAQIDTDAILESGYIEAFIEDAPFSPFSTVGNTEKPDIAAAKMLEGRVAVIVDGTPVVLTVPHLFIEAFQSSEDYYSRPYYVTLVRWFRYLAFFLTVYLPSLYIAVTTFHQEMLPTPLLITMAAAREGTPFPALVEALIMGIIFELLREAGVRMPRPIGQAVSIVGALVIGEAAVSAGLIGAPMVIIVALTAIASFVVPPRIDVAAVLRLAFTIFAGIAGFYGLMLGTLAVGIHLVSLRSFGVPYLSPLAPLTVSDLKDVVVRAPLWSMLTRPRAIGSQNRRRQGYPLKPLPPPAEEKQ